MTIRSLARILPQDPSRPGWVLGWGVLRDRYPWHFVDVYADQQTAQAEARRRGAGYVVEHGSPAGVEGIHLWNEPAGRLALRYSLLRTKIRQSDQGITAA